MRGFARTTTQRRGGGGNATFGERMRVYWLRLVRGWKLLLFVSLFATGAAWVCAHFDWLEMGKAEQDAYDDGLTYLTEWTKDPKFSDDIVIVAIDDLTFQGVSANKSYALNFGSWPYSRNVWARVFEHLSDQGARAIVFDAVIDERHTDPSGDIAMGAIAAEIPTPVYLGFNVVRGGAGKPLPKVEAKNKLPAAKVKAKPASAEEEGEGEGDEEETFEESGDEEETFGEEEETFGEEEESFDEGGGAASGDGYPTVTPEQVAQALAFPITAKDLELPKIVDDEGQAQRPIAPIAPLVDGVSGFGLVLMEEDDDGRLRRTKFAYTDGVNNYATLSVAVVADLLEAQEVTMQPGLLTFGNHEVKINASGDAEIDYGGTLQQRFKSVSMLHVLDDWAFKREENPAPDRKQKLAPDYFKGKVVLIAGFALGTADVKPTPFSASTPGVVKQAAEIQNLLDKQMIVEAPLWVSLLLTFLIGAFSIAIVTVFRSSVLEIAWPLALFYGFFVITGILLVHYQLHVLSAMPAWAASFCSVIAAVANHALEAKDREKLREAFSGSVKSVLLDQLVEEKNIPLLSGETRELTVVLTDINDFSELATRYKSSPEQLASFLNRYLTAVTEVLMEHGGYVNKYTGDTVQAIFGAPFHQPDHAVRACAAALAVRKAVDQLDLGLTDVEAQRFHTRIGISSDPMFIGNFGSDQLVDYTAVGDEMRIAAAVERANERLGTKILISPRTVELSNGQLDVRETAQIELIPGHPAVSLFELKGMAQDG